MAGRIHRAPLAASRRTVLLALSLAALAIACDPPGGPDDDLVLGRNALLQRRFDWARVHFARDLEGHPDRAESWRGAGLAWLSGQQGSLSRAAEHLERYLELEPGDERMARRLAGALLVLGDLEAARRWAESGSGPEARLLRARIDFARGVSPGDEVDDLAAEAAAAGSVALAARAFALAAQIHDRGGETALAAARAERAVELDPFDAPTHYLLARLRRALGDSERAARALDAHRLATELRSAGERATPLERLATLSALEEAVDAESERLRLRRLRLQIDAGLSADARAELPTLLASPTLEPDARLELAASCAALGLRDEAARLYGELTALSADATPDQRRSATLGLARLALAGGDAVEAAAILDRALAREPWVGAFHYLLGRSRLASGDEEGAAAAWQSALARAPWEAGWRLSLADLWLSGGRRSAAARLLAEAPESSVELLRYARGHGLD